MTFRIKLAYGSMPFEPDKTRPRSNFPESRICFSKVQSAKLNNDKTELMAGTEYCGETAVQQRDHIPLDLHPRLQNP